MSKNSEENSTQNSKSKEDFARKLPEQKNECLTRLESLETLAKIEKAKIEQKAVAGFENQGQALADAMKNSTQSADPELAAMAARRIEMLQNLTLSSEQISQEVMQSFAQESAAVARKLFILACADPQADIEAYIAMARAAGVTDFSSFDPDIGLSPLAATLLRNKGTLKAMEALLAANPTINLNAKSVREGDTALHLAARFGIKGKDNNILSFLVEKGANPNIKNNNQETVLDVAVKNGRSADFLDFLIKKGATFGPTIPKNAQAEILEKVEKVKSATTEKSSKADKESEKKPAKEAVATQAQAGAAAEKTTTGNSLGTANSGNSATEGNIHSTTGNIFSANLTQAAPETLAATAAQVALEAQKQAQAATQQAQSQTQAQVQQTQMQAVSDDVTKELLRQKEEKTKEEEAKKKQQENHNKENAPLIANDDSISLFGAIIETIQLARQIANGGIKDIAEEAEEAIAIDAGTSFFTELQEAFSKAISPLKAQNGVPSASPAPEVYQNLAAEIRKAEEQKPAAKKDVTTKNPQSTWTDYVASQATNQVTPRTTI